MAAQKWKSTRNRPGLGQALLHPMAASYALYREAVNNNADKAEGFQTRPLEPSNTGAVASI